MRERQGARRAEVTIAARYPEHKPAPVSGITTQEIYTLLRLGRGLGTRHAAARRRRRPGHDRVPVRAGARRRRRRASGWPRDGFTDEQIERVFEHVPVATHNQRGLGTLHIGCTEACEDEIDALVLLRIVEDSMSSEIYELMKRSDEAAVVEKAHRRPRFVEDCVREMVGGVITAFPDLADAAFVSARQENLETIHQHNVVAERFGRSASCVTRSPPASPPRITRRCEPGYTSD